nr:uncharacterized protein LOC111416906 isoform X2 [Onthophagus taurus]
MGNRKQTNKGYISQTRKRNRAATARKKFHLEKSTSGSNMYLFEDLPNPGCLPATATECVDKYEENRTMLDPVDRSEDERVNVKTYERKKRITEHIVEDAEYQSIQNVTSEKEDSMNINKIHGNRIVNIDYFVDKLLSFQYEHAKKCTFGRLTMVKEYRRGLMDKVLLVCEFCNTKFVCSTQNPQSMSLNMAAVWGTVVNGSTYTQTNDLLSTLDVPIMSFPTFSKIERQLETTWKDQLWLSMETAGKEERRLAEDSGDIDKDGTPWVQVYVDGGWSKRSYGHNYNAASGVAVIIGKRTGKVIFVGVRNKFCTVCCRAENKNVVVPKHVCFKNWTGSSSSMEADIVVEGFNQSIAMHGVKYLKFVADGDSSVFYRIQQTVSYGGQVEKLECVNHAIKNYGKSLYKIKADTSINIQGRKYLTKPIITELQKGAYKAIKKYSGDVNKMKAEISNSIMHVFEHHEKCCDDYCDKKGVELSPIPHLKRTGLLYHINGALENLLVKAHRLVAKETNNRAELYMSLLAKLNCGKRLNLTQRNSFQNRAYITGLRYNEGVSWQQRGLQASGYVSIGNYFMRHMHKMQLKRETRHVASPRKRKHREIVASKNSDYGVSAIQGTLSTAEIESESKRILLSLQVF